MGGTDQMDQNMNVYRVGINGGGVYIYVVNRCCFAKLLVLHKNIFRREITGNKVLCKSLLERDGKDLRVSVQSTQKFQTM